MLSKRSFGSCSWWAKYLISSVVFYFFCQKSDQKTSVLFLGVIDFQKLHCVWKLLKMSHLNFSIMVFSTNFVLLKWTCLVTLFQRLAKWPIFGIFNNFFHSRCKSSSLLSQCWMRLFLGFSNVDQDWCAILYMHDPPKSNKGVEAKDSRLLLLYWSDE